MKDNSPTEPQFKYEILCVDTKKTTDFDSEKGFLQYFISSEKIWKNATIKANTILDKDIALSLKITKIKPETTNKTSHSTFKLEFTGDFEYLADIRMTILKHIEKQGFDYTYVLRDDISKEIARQLYPLINEVETTLRKYLIQFFVLKIGPDWWDMTADSEMKKKTNSGRKNNEDFFSKTFDNKIYLIDFGDLGKMVYLQTSSSINKDNIIDQVATMQETPEAVIELKALLKSNYNKFFKTSFKDKLFQKKWEDLEKIRHKVAHNNLFAFEDLKIGKSLCSELIDIINSANDSIATVDLSTSEVAAIQENIVSESNLKSLSPELFKEYINEFNTNYSSKNRKLYWNTVAKVLIDLGYNKIDIDSNFIDYVENQVIELDEDINGNTFIAKINISTSTFYILHDETSRKFVSHLRSSNKEILLQSEDSESKKDCLDIIGLIKSNSGTHKHYELTDLKDNYSFVLKARNGNVIAKGGTFKTRIARDNCMVTCAIQAKGASIEEYLLT